jgi:fructose-1,6-bisphosphatase I
MADTGNGEKVNTNIVTLTRFLNEEQVKHKEASGDFTYVSRRSRACEKQAN